MSIFSPVTWVPWIPWLGVGYVSWDALFSAFGGSSKVLVGSVYAAIYLLASFWQGQVTKIASEPYLVILLKSSRELLLTITQDEVFHIPQAQAYCSGDFHIWDPKLTTPPGL
jgi:alpha-1,2-glucosyltransferase